MVLSHWLRNVRGFFAYTTHLRRRGIQRPRWKRRARRIPTVAAQTELLEQRTLLSGTIASVVWNDVNGNGAQDGGSETPRDDVTVHLVSVGADGVINGSGSEITGDDVIVATTTTALPLNYARFDNQYGSFYLSYELPDGYTWTLRDAAGDAFDSDVGGNNKSHVFTLVPGGANEITVDAGVVAKDFDLTLEGNFDGDDRPDVAAYRADVGYWEVATTDKLTHVVDDWLFNGPTQMTDHVVGDFNGDGRDDIAQRHATADGWQVLISTGDGFEASNWGSSFPSTTWSELLVGDFTGDGRDDLAGVDQSTGEVHVFVSTGTGFDHSQWSSWNTSETWLDALVGDFNGDGRADLARRADTTGNWVVDLSTGDGFTSSIWGTWNPSHPWPDVVVGDFNGDGYDDIFGAIGSSPVNDWWVAASTGSGFQNQSWGAASSTWNFSGVDDINRDGLDDLVWRTATTWYTATSSGSGFSNDDFGSGYYVDHDIAEFDTTVVDYTYRLDAALRAFESVRNAVDFDPSRGPMKGSLATEQTRQGNAWDQAGLLLNHLQSPEYDIESRLAVGTATADADAVLEWLGVTSELAAESILQEAGLNGVYNATQEEISFLHAWVEVRVSGDGGLAWQPLDPSWKSRSYQDGVSDLLTNVGFSEAAYLYLAQPNSLPLEHFEDDVQEYLANNHPGVSLADVAYSGEIIPEYFDAMPAAAGHLPTSGISTFGSTAALPEMDTHRVRVSIDYENDGTFEIDEVFQVDDIASGRIVVMVDERSSLFYPQIKVWEDASNPYGAGTWESSSGFSSSEALRIKLDHYDPGTASTASADRSVVTTIDAGQVAAVSLNARQDSAFSMRRAEYEFNSMSYTEGVGFDEDEFFERALSLVASKYNYRFNQDLQAIAGHTHSIAVHPHIMSGFVVSDMSYEQVTGLQLDAVPDDLHIDIPNPVFTLLPIDATEAFDSATAEHRMYLAGYHASALEHYVIESLTHTESISTVRGLEIASQATSPSNKVYRLEKQGAQYIDLFTSQPVDVWNTLTHDISTKVKWSIRV